VARTAILLACSLVVACAPPVKVRLDPPAARQLAASSVLTTGELSRRARNLLFDRDLTERYEQDPAAAIAVLHADYVAGKLQPDAAPLISEVAFHHAMHGGGSPYYLAAALYAWAYVFPDDPKDAPDRFNPRTRRACDLYNRGLSEGLKKSPTEVDLGGGTYTLPFGTLEVSVDPATLQWSGHRLTNFYPVDELVVEGFLTYYRWPGIGAPLAAGLVPDQGRDDDILARGARVPVTAVLRPHDLSRALRDGAVQGSIELYPGYGERTVKIGGSDVPLEAEPTATVALTLAETSVWERESAGFFHGSGVIGERARLVSTRPYEPGLIPVVFVHGTGSSAVRWLDLYNELDNDPRVHGRYQFWFFSYETGNPIIYSASLLRDSLERAVAKLDPEGRDPALRRMVVIGHSQGGLLTKAMVVDPGDAFWRNMSRRPLEELTMSDETRELLRRVVFFHPLPFVTQVVFVATPHRGSYVAGSWLAHQVARLIQAPLAITRVVTELATFNQEALAVEGLRGAPTAVDNMTPGNRFVKTLSQLPIAPGVTAHSIIAVDAEGPPQGKNDGVVEYDSAHIDDVASEIVVRSPHSCQSNPHTIEEVRRILLENLGTSVLRGATEREAR
jgi:pimeloyl-ACP methyl ester carboxylesterase